MNDAGDDTVRSPYGNFGDGLNNALNRIGCYCREKNYTAEQAVQIFDAGIFARSAFFSSDQSADRSDASR